MNMLIEEEDATGCFTVLKHLSFRNTESVSSLYAASIDSDWLPGPGVSLTYSCRSLWWPINSLLHCFCVMKRECFNSHRNSNCQLKEMPMVFFSGTVFLAKSWDVKHFLFLSTSIHRYLFTDRFRIYFNFNLSQKPTVLMSLFTFLTCCRHKNTQTSLCLYTYNLKLYRTSLLIN